LGCDSFPGESRKMTTEGKKTAREWYLAGNACRQQGNWQEALHCYMEAIDLDASSPAVEAKQMLENILNFYNKDAYNP